MNKVTITEDQILIDGFEDLDFIEPGETAMKLGSCRDMSRVAIAWALRKLAEEMERDMLGDWESQISVIN